jgi:ribonuclease P protein component
MERQYRLRRSPDFGHVRREGQSWTHPLLILAAAPNGRPTSRFGFVVSKRIGKAVPRNRARRLMRESVRRHLAHITPGWDCVWIARAPFEATLAQVDAAVIQLLQRARLWQAPEWRAGQTGPVDETRSAL